MSTPYILVLYYSRSGSTNEMARQIARAHHGDIHYEARPGGGSCFVMRLPMASGSGRLRTVAGLSIHGAVRELLARSAAR